MKIDFLHQENCFFGGARPVTPIFSDATGHTSSSCYEHTNRLFPHSCKQGHQLEAQVDKIQRFVWNCPPEPCPHFFMFAHWRVMQKRSITPLLQNFFWLEKKKMIKWQATTRLSLFANWIIQYFTSGLLKIVVFLTYAHYGHDMNAQCYSFYGNCKQHKKEIIGEKVLYFKILLFSTKCAENSMENK